MNKENLLFGIVGLLLGLIIGFMVTNSINRNSAGPGGTVNQTENLPEGHPNVPGQTTVSTEVVDAAVEKAKAETGSFDAQKKAAELSYQAQRFDVAVEYFEKANKLNPDDYNTMVNLGNANFDGGKYEEAEGWYAKALIKKADDVNVRTDMGLTFIFRQPPNYDRAIKEFVRSLEVNPKHPQTLQNLVVGYTKTGDAKNAKSTLERLKEVDSSNPAIARLQAEIDKIGS